MSLFKKLFGSDKQSNKKEKVYKSTDNLGTIYTSSKTADAAWHALGMMLDKGNKVTLYDTQGKSNEITSKGYPFICFTFDSEDAAIKGVSGLSFIKKAGDTNSFISLEVLEFGCYELEKEGKWEIIIWGENFTDELYQESNTKLSAAGGTKKGERIPKKKSQDKPKASNTGGKTTYIRTDHKGNNTYEVHKAPSKSVAMDFLKNKSVTKGLYYIIVETPEGNWGKDINGIYQE